MDETKKSQAFSNAEWKASRSRCLVGFPVGTGTGTVFQPIFDALQDFESSAKKRIS